MTTSNEHNNAPAVPQGWRDFLTELSKQKPEKPDYWSSCGQCERNSSTAEDLIAATPAPAPAQGEPFGHFRAEPFGWTDCAKDAEGAIALYEHPAAPAVPQGNDPAWTLAAKVREALDRKACPGYYMDVAVEAVVHNYIYATPAPAPAPAVPAEIDVRTILLGIVPGDGNGHEVYAKTGEDVVNKLTEMAERLDAAEARAPATEQASNFPERLFHAICDEAKIAVGSDRARLQAIRARLTATDTRMPAQEVGLTDDEIKQVFIAAERRMVREPNLSWRDAIVDEVIAALREKRGQVMSAIDARQHSTIAARGETYGG